MVELETRLRQRMAFGTAGLRARMGAGYSRMNCLTVIQTSQGLAQYVKSQKSSSRAESVVIGYDGRKNSRRFAKLAATAFVKMGLRVYLYETYIHTPLVPFGVRFLGAAAGIMITASHNPAADNGYKVYWGPSGCQINSPHDVGIAKSIVHEDNLKPLSWDTIELHQDPNYRFMPAAVMDDYYEKVYKLANRSERIQIHARFVYTPIHGTGLMYMTEMLRRLGYSDDMVVVDMQV